MVLQDVSEGQPFYLPCEEDRLFLESKFRGNFQRRADGWVINRNVGHLRLPSGNILRIRSPKASGASLLAWMAFVDPSLGALRQFGIIEKSTDVDGDLAAVVAKLFLKALLDAASRHGLTRRYGKVRVRTSTIRGRIDFSRLANTGGDLSRVPCTVWERLPETPLNRFLAEAVRVVSRDQIMRGAAKDSLAHAAALLVGIRPAASEALLSGKTPLPRNEQGFEPTCALARLIMKHTALSDGLERDGVSFLINLEMLFEKTVSLAFESAGVEPRHQEPIGYLYFSPERMWIAPNSPMKMDVYCRAADSGMPLVIDAKYKTDVDSVNLQQMVTYCYSTGARRGVLVFPAGHLSSEKKRSCLFPGGLHRTGDSIRIDIVELATDATTVTGWRQAALDMANQVLQRTTTAALAEN